MHKLKPRAAGTVVLPARYPATHSGCILQINVRIGRGVPDAGLES